MSTNHTIRQMIIDEDLPKLVKLLTGFNEGDENFKLCETYAFSRVASHKYLSVNSHEVRRRIDGVAERFMADNYTQYGEKLKGLVQEFVNDPLCTEHYELDVQWSILHFLLELSRNPVSALYGDKKSIQLDDSANGDEQRPDRRRSSAMHDLVNSLIQHNIPTIPEQQAGKSNNADGESDLSEWSDEEDEGAVGRANSSEKSMVESQLSDHRPLRLKLIPTAKEVLRPPEKKSIFTEFDSSKAFEWRDKSVQPAWWLESTPNENVTVLSEWCLLREIIWVLFLEPFDTESDADGLQKLSKSFSLKSDTDEIVANPNITLSSTSVNGLNSILTVFARVATKLYRIQKFLRDVFERPEANTFLDTVQSAPNSIQSYANGLKDYLRIISRAICDLEIEIVEQDLTKTHTIVYLYNQLYPHFRTVDILYDIHCDVYIDFKTNAGYVCVGHLFAGLINLMDNSATVERLNMVASLFLVSIRFYLSVFTRWWIEGKFTDWCSEFLIEKCTNQNRASNSSSNPYQVRSIADGVSRSLDAERIGNLIENCDIIKLFRAESLEAGYILDILYNLDKVHDMKSEQPADHLQEIEIDFMKSFWEEISKFKIEEPTEEGACALPKNAEEIKPIQIEKQHDTNFLLQDLTGESDALLSMAFEEYVSNTNDIEQHDILNSPIDDDEIIDCYKISKRITQITDFPLPLTIIIHDCLRKLLRSRIAVANTYVLRIFLDEYKVLDHIINLQRVFFFGAGDLMLTFYSKLFKQINAGEDWNNAYLLTIHLDEVLSSRFPDIRSMFSVQVEATDSHVKETLSAITDITIHYTVRHSVRDVIHERALTKYNEIFRFLLQVKWAIWTLETLQFPVAFKKRPPYQPLTLIDLIFKRLALVRNWIIYSVQCIHSHLMTFVIQSMGQQLVKRIKKTECLSEIIELHDSYIDTIYQHCFRKTSDIPLRTGVEQLLSLVVVLRDEWNNLQAINSHGDFVDGENKFDVSATVEQVDVIEATYINCHCHIAEVLTREVYSKNETALASLSAAFNCSCPY